MAFADNGAGGTVLESGPRFTVTLKAGVSCEAGTLLGYDSSADIVLAKATVGAVVKTAFVALHKITGVSGVTKDVQVSTHAVIKGRISGATVGGPIYCDEPAGSSTGKVTQTAPSTTGDVKTQVGTALTADTELFNIPVQELQALA